MLTKPSSSVLTPQRSARASGSRSPSPFAVSTTAFTGENQRWRSSDLSIVGPPIKPKGQSAGGNSGAPPSAQPSSQSAVPYPAQPTAQSQPPQPITDDSFAHLFAGLSTVRHLTLTPLTCPGAQHARRPQHNSSRQSSASPALNRCSTAHVPPLPTVASPEPWPLHHERCAVRRTPGALLALLKLPGSRPQ